MTTNFSEGPYSFEYFVDSGQKKFVRDCILNKDGKLIGSVWNGNLHYEGNKYLLTASWDLLAALERCVEELHTLSQMSIRTEHGDFVEVDQVILDAAYEAIQKANPGKVEQE